MTWRDTYFIGRQAAGHTRESEKRIFVPPFVAVRRIGVQSETL